MGGDVLAATGGSGGVALAALAALMLLLGSVLSLRRTTA
jgi:LPXTG-motif cell wall-anchored protein